MDELVIDESNFSQYFFDARKHKPQPGQILVKYVANCRFQDGPEKKQMVGLLCMKDRAIPAVQVMQKLFFACRMDAVRVPLAIATDLYNGMSLDAVCAKSYDYTGEFYFYTEPQYLPKDDPRWMPISILYLDKHSAKIEES
jgi:hypothetical protein